MKSDFKKIELEDKPLRPNEAGKVVRVLAFFLALFCFSVFGLFIFTGSSSSDGLSISIGSLIMGLIALRLSIKGFIPPWLVKLIPYYGVATSGSKLRRK